MFFYQINYVQTSTSQCFWRLILKWEVCTLVGISRKGHTTTFMTPSIDSIYQNICSIKIMAIWTCSELSNCNFGVSKYFCQITLIRVSKFDQKIPNHVSCWRHTHIQIESPWSGIQRGQKSHPVIKLYVFKL